MIMSYRLYVYINYYYYLFFLDDGMLFLKNKYYFKNKKTKGNLDFVILSLVRNFFVEINVHDIIKLWSLKEKKENCILSL